MRGSVIRFLFAIVLITQAILLTPSSGYAVDTLETVEISTLENMEAVEEEVKIQNFDDDLNFLNFPQILKLPAHKIISKFLSIRENDDPPPEV